MSERRLCLNCQVGVLIVLERGPGALSQVWVGMRRIGWLSLWLGRRPALGAVNGAEQNCRIDGPPSVLVIGKK